MKGRNARVKFMVPFLDLSVSTEEQDELLSAIQSVFTHGRIVLGPEVEEFEAAIAEYCGRKFAVGVNSGTDALIVAIRSLDLPPGSEIITTPLSWIASTHAIVLAGHVPVFADIQTDLNIDPKSIKQLITNKTKAILPVHFTGKMCQIDAIREIALEHNLQIVEDTSQAIGAMCNGERAGSFGSVSALSCNPMKILGAVGEAGVVLTDDSHICERLLVQRYCGMKSRSESVEVTGNNRLDTIQAAILLKRLRKIEAIIEKRRAIAAFYREALSGLVETPVDAENCRDVYYNYTIKSPQRDKLWQYLEEKGIECRVQHEPLIPDQSVYRGKYRGDYPRAKEIIETTLCIPMHEKLSDGQVEFVCASTREFFEKYK